MSVINEVTVRCTILLLLFASALIHAQESPPIGHGNVPGSECLPANLQQAVNLGLGWDQRGVRNGEPLSGSSFFIVCPLSKQYGSTIISVSVELEKLVPSARAPACSLFRHDGFSPITQAIFLPLFFEDSTFVSRISVFSSLPWNPSDDSYSVVCALHPQTRLNTIYFRDEVVVD